MTPPPSRLPVLLLAAAAASGCLAHTPAIPGADGRPLPGSIASLGKLQFGGTEQWLLIRGADTTNPVPLRLHGGPGTAEMPVVRRYNGDLEEHFVVVAWDQRGAGKSNRSGFDEASVTFEQFLQDAHELTLLVNQERSTEIAHTWLSERLREEGRSGELARLEVLGPPPYRDHDTFRRVPRLEVPVYFFTGRHDYNTPLVLVREYAESLEAPAGKEVVVSEESAHTPFLAEPERFRDEMLRVKEETFVPAHPGPGLADGPAEREAADPGTERVILPFLLYTPETKLGGGAVAAGYRRLQPDLPVSNLLGAATVTVRRQISLEATAELHLSGGERVDASARFEHFPDRFFGVGPGTPDEAEEAYTSRIFYAELRGQRQVSPGLRVGPRARLRWENVVETEEAGLLATGDLIASDGGSWLGLGALATYDTRDHVVNPRQGVYVELSALAFPEALGTTGYRNAVLDARRFLPLGSESTVAFRAYLEGSGGDVPVLLLPSLGGRERLRGYYEGRLRDRMAGAAQGEVRFPLWRRLGGVAFAEVGQVGPRLGDLASGRAEHSAGTGLRFRLGEDAARIRADFAVGRRGSGLYLTIGEAF